MNCTEASEYLSSLCDGETVPSTAAEHIGSCDACRNLLTEYAAMGAELRRVASLELHDTPKPLHLNHQPRRWFINAWWQKGTKTMRIPRLAFALLVVAVLALGSTLVIGKVRARSEGNVAALKIDFGSGQPQECFLDAAKTPPDACGGVRGLRSLMLSYQFEILARDRERFELGVRSRVSAIGSPGANSDVHQEPQQQLWFTPGETSKVELAGGATASVSSEWQDHVPTSFAQNGNPGLDPNPTELRIASPLLLRDETVMGDMEGAIGTVSEANSGVVTYFPKAGRFIFSLESMSGAVLGHVSNNRITFELDGRSYTLITGEPVARAEQVWVLYDPDFRSKQQGGFLGAGRLQQLAKLP